jgi:centrin-1
MFLDIMTANNNNKLTKKNIKKTFNLFDDEKTGFISIKNLRKLTK